MKQTWIHFIGKSYYTIPAFIKEAEKINVSRAVSPQVFRKMNLGDLVLLAQKNGAHTLINYYGNTRIETTTKNPAPFIRAGFRLALQPSSS